MQLEELKIGAVLAMVVVLAGCGPTKQQEMAECRMKARAAHLVSHEDRAPEALFTDDCMTAKGWTHDPGMLECSGRAYSALEITCYRWSGWLGEMFRRERPLEANDTPADSGGAQPSGQ